MSSSTTITKTISQRRRSWGKGRTMAGESQKLKLLNLAKMLYERTDESHGLTCPEIIAGLAEAGIEAERKSVYRDLDALRDFGLDIAKLPTYPVSYASSRAPSPPPSSCCSPTPCSPRAFSRFAWPIASPKAWRLWAPATRPPRFPRTCTWKAASRCRTNRCSTTWTRCTRPSAATGRWPSAT